MPNTSNQPPLEYLAVVFLGCLLLSALLAGGTYWSITHWLIPRLETPPAQEAPLHAATAPPPAQSAEQPPPQRPAFSGTIAGSILDAQGTPAANRQIVLSLQMAADEAPEALQEAWSDTTGAFAFTHLARTGTYLLMAEAGYPMQSARLTPRRTHITNIVLRPAQNAHTLFLRITPPPPPDAGIQLFPTAGSVLEFYNLDALPVPDQPGTYMFTNLFQGEYRFAFAIADEDWHMCTIFMHEKPSRFNVKLPFGPFPEHTIAFWQDQHTTFTLTIHPTPPAAQPAIGPRLDALPSEPAAPPADPPPPPPKRKKKAKS